jgi:hypothetical protein
MEVTEIRPISGGGCVVGVNTLDYLYTVRVLRGRLVSAARCGRGFVSGVNPCRVPPRVAAAAIEAAKGRDR